MSQKILPYDITFEDFMALYILRFGVLQMFDSNAVAGEIDLLDAGVAIFEDADVYDDGDDIRESRYRLVRRMREYWRAHEKKANQTT